MNTCEHKDEGMCFPCWESAMKEQFPGKAWND
jgi:hypothetical protein